MDDKRKEKIRQVYQTPVEGPLYNEEGTAETLA